MAEENAASRKTPLSDISEFRELLLEERDHLVRQMRDLSSASLVSSRQAGEELADVGSDDFMRETELSLVTEEGRTLALIQTALQDIDSGDYGICIDCGCDIPVGRLRAKPYARLCVDCKSYREQNGGQPPQGTDSEGQLVE